MSKKYFEAVGRQALALNLGFPWPPHYRQLPRWAKDAIARGYTAQMERWDRAVMRKPT